MAELSAQQVEACVHPRQRPRFVLALICAVLLAPLMVLIAVTGTIFLVLPLIVFLVWISMRVIFANFVGNSILVSATNYPRIHELAEELKVTLGVNKPIFVFVYQQGEFNAFMMRLFFRRAVFLNSELLESGVSDDEVRWLIGRFVGYWRAQRNSGFAGWLIRMAQRFLILNFFILPYDRAQVYTGDRLALAVIGGDISTGASAMQKLLVGRQLGYSVNPVGMLEQHRRVKGSVFAFLARLSSPFPHTTARYVDLIAFAQRAFPEQFRRFEATNPGLPEDLAQLSAERASPVSGLLMGAAAVGVGLVLLLGGWAAVTALRHLPSGGALATAPGLPMDASTPASPAPAAAYDTAPLDPSVRDAVEQAHSARANADSMAALAQSAAQQAQGAAQSARNGETGYQVSEDPNDANKSRYEGGWSNNTASGYGVFALSAGPSAGDRYEGAFANGLFNGSGVYHFAQTQTDGAPPSRYEGAWTDGRRAGAGVLYPSAGGRYSGDWADDREKGFGVIEYADGTRYEGALEDDAPNGYGVMWDANGAVREAGNWTAGALTQALGAQGQ